MKWEERLVMLTVVKPGQRYVHDTDLTYDYVLRYGHWVAKLIRNNERLMSTKAAVTHVNS